MNARKFRFALRLLLLLPLLSILLAADTQPARKAVAPDLQRIITRCPADSVLSVMVKVEGGAQAGSLRRELDAAGIGRRESHRILIERLKFENDRAQRGLLDGLGEDIAGGTVKKLRRFWITNIVSLDIEAGQVALLAELPGVSRVFLNREIRLTGYKGSKVLEQAGTEWNIWKIRAPSLWGDGFTGRGVLVCVIDSGADGTHPALSSKWRGASIPGSAASWHDPYNFSSFPVDDDVSLGPTHGTAVTGIIVGSEGSDTVGVAPGAQWIAANAFEGPSQSSSYEIILDCLEWAADPDGDPTTVSDVPDVVNNSWGTPGPGLTGLCEDVLWDAIDAVEAAGAMVFFAAGNYGPSPSTTTSPSSRIDSDVNTFAVGATGEFDQVPSFSGRGPSPCDNVTIKPEAVAPGDAVRSSRGVEAGGGYQINSGTSFATPHVTGLAALLRQSSSTSSGDEVKRGILNSATDLGDAGEDNESGMGLINAEAAQLLLDGPESPVLRVLSIDPSPLTFSPGDTSRVSVTVYNMGLPASDVLVTLTDLEGIVEVSDGNTSLGTIASYGEASNTADPLEIYTGQEVALGTKVPMRLTVSSQGQDDFYNLTVFVGEPNTAGSLDHTAGNVVFTVTNFGQYGFNNGMNQVGSGFRFPADGPNWLFTGFFLAGTGSGAVSDGLGGLDTDWAPAEGSVLHILRSGGKADEEGRARYDDASGNSPLPIAVYQRSYAFSDPEREDFVILHYLVKNSGVAALDSMYAGLYFDWDINANAFNRNEVGWIDTLSLGYMFNTDFDQRMGLTLLAGPLTSHRAINVVDDLYNVFGAFGFSDEKKWDFLTAGFEQPVSTSEADWAHMLSVGPLNIDAGDSVEFAYAVLAGAGLPDLMENADRAQEAWDTIQTDPPPVFLISVLADPLVSEYLKLSAVPSEPLTGEPVLTVDGEIVSTETITASNVILYTADYIVQSEGDHIVTVSGVDQGGATGQSSEWFTALQVGPGLAGEKWSRDGKFRFSFPEGIVDREGFIYLTEAGVDPPVLPPGLLPVAGPYSLLPAGLDLKQSSTVSFRIEDGNKDQASPGFFRILAYTENGWEDLEVSQTETGEVSARISKLGFFVLAEGTGLPDIPGSYNLSQNFPNPFNPQTTIVFDVPDGEGAKKVRVEIFNLRGQLVRTLFSGEKQPGSYELVWDGKDFRGDDAASGIYLCSMVVDNHAQTRKMVLLK